MGLKLVFEHSMEALVVETALRRLIEDLSELSEDECRRWIISRDLLRDLSISVQTRINNILNEKG